ncbi:hypothetical protein [Butyrivibrio sp. JL13D10]|uniref:hypothetical protein n=1 Tax=Butyrivibrio sp. JL13D10 TaxID=3236815 RepID=UPI0038B51483
MAHKEIFPIRVNLVSFLNDFYSLRDKIDISYRVVSITFPLYIILTFVMDNRPDYVSKYDQKQE